MFKSFHRIAAQALAAGSLLASATLAIADSTPQTLPFSQDWSDINQVSANDDWSGVPGITGYRGDDLVVVTGIDPQTILVDGTGTPIDVNANQTNPNAFATGGVNEFELVDPAIALAGSGTSDAPFLLIALDTTAQSGIRVQYRLRDLEDGVDNAAQAVALQYRIGNSGDFINIGDAFVADATAGPNAFGPDIPVDVVLPADADNQPLLQLRIITTNAIGNDENVGIDDISVTAQPGGGGSDLLVQDWTDTGLITANDDWSGVPGIVGYRGDDLVVGTGIDPQTILVDGTNTPIDVNANQTNPNAFATGGVAEFELANPTIALSGSGTADAPFLLISVDTTGQFGVRIQYTLRDLEDTTDNAAQAVALHYRVGNTGDFTNVPEAFVADATAGPSAFGPDTPVDVVLPFQADNVPLLQLRIMTTNAAGNDEHVGIDDIIVSANTGGGDPILSIDGAAQAEGDVDTAPMAFTVTLSEPAPVGGVSFTATTEDVSATAPLDYIALDAAPFIIPEGETSAIVNVQIVGDTVIEPDESFTVTIATNASDVIVGNATATGTIEYDDFGNLSISEIQGNGLRSPLAPISGNDPGIELTTEANIVTAISSNGFFMQTMDGLDDGDATTSEGLFVFTGDAPSVQIGDLVDVTGAIQEFNNWTQLTNVVVIVMGTGLPLPTAIELDETVPSANPLSLSCGETNFECLENMRVHVAAGAVVQGNQRYSSDLFAEAFVTASGERTRREKGLLPNLPSPIPGLPVWDGNPEVFELDADGAGAVPVGTPIFGGELFEATGVIAFQFGNYALRASELLRIEVELPRPVADPAGADELRVGSLNALNLCTGNCNADKVRRVAEYIGDVLKLPDVIGLQEVGNDVAAQTLATRLNSDYATDYAAYSFPPPAGNGIRVAFLARSSRVDVIRVRELQADATLDQCSGAPPCPLHDRPPLLLEGEFIGGDGEPFAVMNNHTRSLIGIGDPAPEGPRVRFKRFEQGKAIAQLVQRFQNGEELDPDNPIGNVDTADVPLILVGDYNAFEVTDGYVDMIGLMGGTYVDAENEYQLAGPNIVDPPLRNIVLDVADEERYSYTFREDDLGPLIGESPRQVGSIQVLDHALLNLPALDWCGGLLYGRGNADAPAELRNSSTTALAVSDHDGYVVRLFTDRLFAHDFEQPGQCMR